MTTELEEKYKEYIHNTEIAFIDEVCEQRGVFASEDIKIGDVLLKIPLSECVHGNHMKLTYALMDMNNEYSRSLPVCITHFPVMWTPYEIESLEGSAMKQMIPARKTTLLKENKKDGIMDPLFLHYRLLVGSRAFSLNNETGYLVPYADMLNTSNDPNVDWKIKDDHFILKALKEIPKGEQCFDAYGTKTNYENLLFYGMVLKDNVVNDVTYELMEIPSALRKNINYKYFKNTVEFELCGAYSRGTVEIFSLIRFLVCSNASKKDCPLRLNGFDCKPISKANELVVVQCLYKAFVDIYNKKIIKLKDVCKKVEDFAATEVNVLMHWIDVLKRSATLLNCKTMKAAKKAIGKEKPNDYITYVVKRLIFDKRAYIK